VLEKLGLLPLKPKEAEFFDKILCNFKVGVEKYVATEGLFTPAIMGIVSHFYYFLGNVLLEQSWYSSKVDRTCG
jgi:hypothetical protein